MITDEQGNILTGATPEAAMLLDEALGAFNIYRGDPFALLDRAARRRRAFPWPCWPRPGCSPSVPNPWPRARPPHCWQAQKP